MSRYEPIRATIADAITDAEILFPNLEGEGNKLAIVNRTPGTVLNVKINETTEPAIPVEHDSAGTIIGISLDNQDVSKLYLTNASGQSIDYTILVSR